MTAFVAALAVLLTLVVGLFALFVSGALEPMIGMGIGAAVLTAVWWVDR